MTNGEKYMTADERAKAFRMYHNEHYHDCRYTVGKESPLDRCVLCVMEWLDLEAEEEKPLPCPFCGAMCEVTIGCVECANGECCYTSGNAINNESAIAAHNRVAKSVMDAKAKEVAK